MLGFRYCINYNNVCTCIKIVAIYPCEKFRNLIELYRTGLVCYWSGRIRLYIDFILVELGNLHRLTSLLKYETNLSRNKCRHIPFVFCNNVFRCSTGNLYKPRIYFINLCCAPLVHNKKNHLNRGNIYFGHTPIYGPLAMILLGLPMQV